MIQPRRTDRPSATERLIEHGWSIMIYDGNCVLCSTSVRFVARRSRGRLLAFCAMQSAAGRESLAAVGDGGEINQSLLVRVGNTVLRRSDAVLHLLASMDAPWPLLGNALRYVPRRLRDPAYSWVARNRYRLLGRRKACLLAEPDMVRRFVQ